MLNRETFVDICGGLPTATQKKLMEAWDNPPLRSVSGSYASTARFPSRKMAGLRPEGISAGIQAESGRPELKAILWMEYSDHIVGYLDQAFRLWYAEIRSNGRPNRRPTTVDFVVIESDRQIYLDEWKQEDRLQRDLASGEGGYRYLGDSKWSHPAKEAAAQALGLTYRLRSSSELSPILHANFELLEDYWRRERAVTTPARTSLLEAVTQAPGSAIPDLLARTTRHAGIDDLLALVASGDLYVDLQAVKLDQPNCRVFTDKAVAEALGFYAADSSYLALRSRPKKISLTPGVALSWGQQLWTVLNSDSSLVFMQPDGISDVRPVGTDMVHQLIKDGHMRVVAEPDARQQELSWLSGLPPNERMDLMRRYRNVLMYRAGERNPKVLGAPVRTIQDWNQRMGQSTTPIEAMRRLQLNYHRSGWAERRLPETVVTLMEEDVRSNWLTAGKPPILPIWKAFRDRCLEAGMPLEDVPSYLTYWRTCTAVSPREAKRRREGEVAAYQLGPAGLPGSESEEHVFWLEYSTPVHGSFLLHRAHADHTQADYVVVERHRRDDGRVEIIELGRPWISWMIDGRTRTLLALCVSFSSPSYVTVMRLIRECVRRWGRLPRQVVLDNGKEFKSNALLALSDQYDMTLVWRPKRKARAGSVIERAFGAMNTGLLYTMLGNTQATKKVRQLTNSVDPRLLSDKSLPQLAADVQDWGYEKYDQLVHSTLGMSPRAARAEADRITGARDHITVLHDAQFLADTMPEVPGETRKVQPGRGVKVNHIYYYNSKMESVAGRKVPVKFDPDRFWVVYVLIDKQWEPCEVVGWPALLQGITRQESGAVLELVRARHNALQRKGGMTVVDFVEAYRDLEGTPIFELERERGIQDRLALEVIEGRAPAKTAGSEEPLVAPPLLEIVDGDVPVIPKAAVPKLRVEDVPDLVGFAE